MSTVDSRSPETTRRTSTSTRPPVTSPPRSSRTSSTSSSRETERTSTTRETERSSTTRETERSSTTRATERSSTTRELPSGARVETTELSDRAQRISNTERSRPTTSSEPTPEERKAKEERDHIKNLDQNFDVFDNPGGGKTDGTVSNKDIEKVADGDYDREKAEERLREAGVPADQIDERLDSIEETAEYLLENDSVRNRVDVANDDDGEGDADGKISRGDLDRVMVKVEAEEREARIVEQERAAQQPPSEEHIAEAQEAVQRWNEPGALREELADRPLADFSDAELDALVAVNENNPEARKQIETAILENIDEAEYLDDLPGGDSFNFLLDQHVTGKEVTGDPSQQAVNPTAVAQRQLDGLVREEIEASLDHRLNDRKGDDELDLALERVSGDLEDLAIDNPALVNSIQSQAEATFQDYGDEFTEVARRDDNFLQKTNHAVTGGIRDGVGFVADGFRFAVDVTARVSNAPTRIAGRLANVGLTAAGSVAGAGLDVVGADGAADFARNAGDSAGNFAQSGADFVATQNENFTRGLGESVAGGVEGLAYAVTDPKGAVEGVAAVVQDPSLLVEGYAETAREHGAAGAAGQITGDVLLTVFTGGTGAAARGASAAGRVASIASRGGRASSFVARSALRSQNYLDNIVQAGGTARYAVGRGAQAAERVRGLFPDGTPRAARALDETPATPASTRRGPDLDAEQQAVSDRIKQQLDENPEPFIDRYLEKHGNRVDLDEARNLFPEYEANPARFNDAVHRGSGRVSTGAYDRLLEAPAGPDSYAVFTGGGAGSGKSSALSRHTDTLDGADAVFDSTLSNFGRSREVIDKALDSGRDAGVFYVYRDPLDAFQGVLKRADETGRPVNIDAFVATHTKSRQTINELIEHYGGDDRFQVQFIDNSGPEGTARAVNQSELPPAPDPAILKENLLSELEIAHQNGIINDEIYTAIAG